MSKTRIVFIQRTARRRAFSFRLIAAGVALLCLVAAPVAAQTFRGTILGTVTDPQGAVVQGAAVTARNTGTGLERTATTDADGNYTIAELPIGTYDVVVRATGFAEGRVVGATVEVAGERRADVSLLVSGSAENVVVNATTTQVESTSNTLGGTIPTRQVEDLPINGRDFTKFLVLVPGATGDPSGATDSPGSFGLFSANGNRGRSINYLLDGTDMNDGYRNLPAINEAGVFGTPATILPVASFACTACAADARRREHG
ncbi:MAG TPA: carboxypeptidase-like regulatory domain-containing protein [Pyrinomonadaceae bacterium]